MRVSFKVPFYSVHGTIFGELGLLTNAVFSCGWSRIISAGLQIVLLCRVFNITRNVCCVIRKRKPSITCWFLVSSLGNTGFSSYKKFGPQILAPQPAEPSFEVWWSWSNEIIADQDRQGLNSLIILGAWSLWTHRNWCVFDGASPTLQGMLASVHEEAKLWGLAGVKGHSLVDWTDTWCCLIAWLGLSPLVCEWVLLSLCVSGSC